MSSKLVNEPLSALDLDLENPRFPETEQPTTQQGALAAILQRSVPHFLRLVSSLARDGYQALEPIIGVRLGKRIRVLEGNRRLAALLALENPERINALLTAPAKAILKQQAAEFAKIAPKTIGIHVFDTEAEASGAILRRHTGANGGAGLVAWASPEIDRYLARFGKRPSYATQVLAFLRANGVDVALSDDGRGITTTLDRVFKTPAVREQLGMRVHNGLLQTEYPVEAVVPGLKRVVDDFRSRKMKVKDVMEVEDRKKYARRLPSPVMPKGYRSSGAVALADAPRATSIVTKGPALPLKSATRTPKARRPRKTLIPRSTQINIVKPRVRDLFVELQSAPMSDTKNLTAIGFRVLLELSVTEYLTRHKSVRPVKDQLDSKMLAAAQHLETAGTLDLSTRRIVARAASDKSGNYAGSAYALNQMVHNANWHPDMDGLQRAWDELEPFLIALWPQ